MWCRKIIISSLIISTLSLLNIILCLSNSYSSSVSALGYETKTGVSFTFNPSLSLSISSLDLVIDNLTPDTTADSNSINISVATNAAYGYTLSAITSNNNLTRSYDVSSVFNGIPTDANLENLATDNTWGYSTSLDNGSSWSNYNGLSSSSSTTLLDTNTNNTLNNGIDSVSFKIGAKAGGTQPSGIYTNAINFTVVSKPIPVTLLDAFIAYNAKQYNGYYTMQSMTPEICSLAEEGSELQLIDIRDNKLYWVAKLKDNNCWMTQNLDLDLSHEVALTSETSDIDPESYGTTIYTTETGYSKDETTEIVSWIPERSTYTSVSAPGSQNWAGDTGDNTTSGYYHPYSWNRIANNNGDPVYPDSTVTKAVAGNHAQSGNYYNWSAAVASNYSYAASGSQKNSICPSGWRLPANGEYGTLYNAYKTASNNNNAYGLMAGPLWFVRSGGVTNNYGALHSSNVNSFYWTSTVLNSNHNYACNLFFTSSNIYPNNGRERYYGLSLRCITE